MKPKIRTSTVSPKLIHSIKAALRRHSLHTVCEEARCPNLGECFSRGTATFMILGDTCTRSCKFCGVKSLVKTLNYLESPSRDEPASVARIVAELGLKHVVITSVTRDDLADEGAGQFAATISAVKTVIPAEAGISLSQLDSRSPLTTRGDKLRGNDRITIEVLTPDFHARPDCLETVCGAGPSIYNHNIETVRRLTPTVRSHADYDRSLSVLKWVASHFPDIIVKSGLMVGLGEAREEVVETLGDLCKVNCKVVTIGQYLQPNKSKLPVVDYIEQAVFDEFKRIGEGMGIDYVFSGPFVRSSYMAEKVVVAEQALRLQQP